MGKVAEKEAAEEKGDAHLGEERNVRLAMIATDFYAFDVLCRGQLEYFSSRSVDLTLLAGGDEETLGELKAREVGRVEPIPFERRPNVFRDLLALLRLVIFLTINRFDAVVCSTPKAMLLGSLAAFVSRQPRRVAFVRGRAYENLTGFSRRFYELMDRITFAICHDVIFVSHSLENEYRADGLIRSDKGRVLGAGSSNGVDTVRFSACAAAARRKCRVELGLDASDFHIVIVGRVAPEKGIEDVLRIVDRTGDIENLKWTFVGRVEDKALLAQILAREGRVKHLRHTENVERIFQAADLHLFLSAREGFGNVALEAAACGVPTFAYDVVGLRDSVRDNVSGRLFPQGDVLSIETDIREAVESGSAFSHQFPDARKWAVESFDQSTVWDAYLRAFTEAPLHETGELRGSPMMGRQRRHVR